MFELRFDRSEPFSNFNRQFPLAIHLIESLLRPLSERTKFCSKRRNLSLECPNITLDALDFRSNCILNNLFEVLIEV